MLTIPILVSMLSTVAPDAQTTQPIAPAAPADQRRGEPGQLNLPNNDIVAFRNSIYDANGQLTSTLSASNGGTFTLYLSRLASFCGRAAASDDPFPGAAYEWRVAVQTLGFKSIGTGGQSGSMLYTEATINLEWQRVWEGGRRVDGPSGKMRLTLHPGDRVPLDTIVAPADASSCAASSMTLSVEPFPAQAGAATRAAAAVATAKARASAMSPDADTSQSRGGGGLEKSVSKRGACVPEKAAASGRSAVTFVDDDNCYYAASTLDPAALQRKSIELWLVHERPDGTSTQQFQRVETIPGGGAFAFGPVTVDSPDRQLVAGVFGFVQAARLPGGTERLEVGFARSIRGLGAPRAIAVGGGTPLFAMPKTGEVVSIELPSGPGAATLFDHRFSIRLRVAP